ncbi:TPA: site-specific DNA-methyltransferase [Klebsiella pneumoniae]|uniref:site-specific DNA-methyltransferase (adenine-specific) n=4 Tax=Enterobacterales TaxID=91347 RepID=A0AAN4A850_CITFR|nr:MULTISPECIES: site-specific DNA-methyltransferase [Enterobacterales]MIC85323.1 site-specific DNA-methyltransferase [Escherichia coli]EKN3888293.1 site-specific DNA-methyltransferase [Yersinia enterocolitica]EKN4720398.1 site-specific DNA-methyltransferase [Yersinia enterocolitica]EKN4732508.1 site-specific DNA-methyltransferase [Yersinia enterocolitica]EKN5063634.1 site-specific DNA-methyltransferase [Yersinia enterocolitica]
MEKLKMHSPNLTQDNIVHIRDLFPGCVTEAKGKDGSVKLAVDFDQLRQELAESIVEGPQERYHLNWPGKREALLAANAPIAKTLRPCREESVDFDDTKNIFIEGDNLDALKLLQENYLGKVKMIYIDPPYNTGNDFIYEDDFSESAEDFLRRSNQKDAEGNKLVANPASNGRFHSDWLSMIYSRLRLARTLLREDGVIFASIDDCESQNIRKVLDEIFGESNFVAQLVWEKKKKGAFLSGSSTNVKEYVVAYAKNLASFKGLVGEIARGEETYPVIKTTNSRGVRVIKKGIPSKYREKNHRVAAGSRISSGNMEMILLSDLVISDGVLVEDVKVESNWIYSQELLNKYAEDKSLYVTQDLYFRRVVTEPREKMLKDLLPMKGDQSTGFEFVYSDDLFSDGWGTNEDGFDELHAIFGAQSLMSFPKPSKLLAKLTLSACRSDPDCIVLDFFAGSATTAHGVMTLNSQDGGNRKFILVQLPETCDESTEAFKAGYKTIADISKERIRRVGTKLLEGKCHQDWKKDIGFRTLKIDTSNMADVYYAPDALHEANLDLFVDNIKPDRTPEDLLFQVMLDWGVDLALPIAKQSIQGKDVFFVDGNVLAACFDASGSIDEAFVKELAKRQPLRVVFRDAGYKNSAVKINVEQIFKLLSPVTEVKCI